MAVSQSDDARVDLKFPAIFFDTKHHKCFAQCYVCGVIEIIVQQVQSALMSAGGRIKYLIKYLMRVLYKARMISIYSNQPPCVLH
jgi:hypothetical protein